MKLKPSFPLWVSEYDASLTETNGLKFSNNGEQALNVFKMYIDANAIPVDEFYGFPMPRGTPFMKATGNNEIEVITERRGVQCWMYGNEYGTGYCRALQNPANYYYERLTQFRDMNFMVCKIGTNPASDIGDIILVPFT